MKQKYLLLLMIFALALTACGTPAATTPVALATVIPAGAVVAEGHIVPAKDSTLAFQSHGTVIDVRVKIGDQVKAGDVLARIGGMDDAAFQSAQVELVNAQQALKTLNDTADSARARAQIALKKAQDDYDKAVDYYEGLFNPQKYTTIAWTTVMTPAGPRRIPRFKTIKSDKADDDTITDASNDMDLKKALLDEAQRTLDRMKNGPDSDQLALAQARLASAEANIAAFAITAPFDGTVMDINAAVGDQAGPENWAIKVADTSSWYVETSDLTELEVVKVKVGQKVSFVPDALPDAKMTGAVDTISQAFTMSGGDVQYKVKIKADKIDPRVLWGMTVEVTFEPQ